MITKNTVLVLLLIFITSCSDKLFLYTSQSIAVIPNQQNVSKNKLKNWSHLDLSEDSIPGVSLIKAYNLDFLSVKTEQEVVVAIIDTQIDINHEDLNGKIWRNKREVNKNRIDDDKNGYIDDINGWDYLVNSKGESLARSDFEFVRIVRKFKPVFDEVDGEISKKSQPKNYELYKIATKKYEEALVAAKKDQEYGDFLYYNYPKSKDLLKKLFPKEDYTIKELDSLYNVYKDIDDKKAQLVYFMSDFLKYDLSVKWIEDYKNNADDKINKSLNIGYNPRQKIGDDYNNINDINYGTGDLTINKNGYSHGTLVAGIIAAKRNNNIGIDGFYDHVKIMPLSISCSGDEYDKDISLAIRYAVDNGANIINMSFAKEFSIREDWVKEAIIYANKKDVLIVGVASNENIDIDKSVIHPNDFDDEAQEIVDNFIVVGSTSYILKENLKSSFSNYGKNNVDIFAPGEDIYTLEPNNKYDFQSGTSVAAPVVSGVAALIKGYYPSLKMLKIKEIIMNSGVKYNIDVEIDQEDGTKKLIPFSELSKSGKIVNAYNALIMAEEIYKAKN
ncbi:S8 family serine peptidase [Aquimarina latercula]|uniref:S8 family serine peptidase n=1 Tax=Aquimarina latercula TaxID=987 RepID=UPI000419382C|nr:S8 family serine peptidase [Aquimarina latercula]